MTQMVIIWLVILIAAIVIEVATLGLTTIWFAGGALIALLAAVVHAPIALQILLFLIISLVLLFFTRPVAMKYFNKNRERTNAESLVGKQAIVISEINNLQGIGTVTVNGQEWSARSLDDTAIAAQKVVEIVSINGVRLIVKPIA